MKSASKGLNLDSMTGAQRAAVLMISLGPEASASVLRQLPADEIEEVSLEIARLGDVPTNLRTQIFDKVGREARNQEDFLEGGLTYAQSILERALGEQEASELVTRLQGSVQTVGFEALRSFDTTQLVNFLRSEHPQTIALVLAHLRPMQASSVLSLLPTEVQPDIIARLATMEEISADTIAEIEGVLTQNLSNATTQNTQEVGGVAVVAEIMKRLDKTMERNILSTLDRENPEVSQRVKNLMFIFEDLLRIDDRGIQRLLKEVDTKELGLGLKAASEELKDLVFRNMSERAVEMLKEELDLMGPVKLKTVEEAQRNIIESVRSLEEQGEIAIAGRGGQQEDVVL